MISSTSRNNAKKQSQEEIKRQIALLQACLEPQPQPDVCRPKSPKRKAQDATILAPATPSPKKKRRLDCQPSSTRLPQPQFESVARHNIAPPRGSNVSRPEEQFKKPPPSNLLKKLELIGNDEALNVTPEFFTRSSGFKDTPMVTQSSESQPFRRRDDRLAIIDDLQPGPYEHRAPYDDPEFEKLEPHSGISLSYRGISHEEFSDYLRGRYYLSPSRLYSCIRLLPDKQGYDVPVPGDWVTIAVIAERGPIKFTRASAAVEQEDNAPGNRSRKDKGKDSGSGKVSGKKYVNLKLIDFGARSNSSSSAGGVSSIRGDAFLTLLLFEADTFDVIQRDDDRKPEKVYRGGSRGAFEHLTNVKEGDVIALLNPKILKPFQRANDSPHPVDNVLALTPESAESIMVIGRSRDLGMCTVRKQDGKVCGSWCDKRLSDICDYHVQHAVQRRRAARPEFSVGTSGMSTSSKHKAKNGYDPMRKWGLKPAEENGPGTTYVVSGHIISGGASDPQSMYISETMGREGQAKAKRQMDARNSEKVLKALLERDKEGMEAVMRARAVNKAGSKEEKRPKASNRRERVEKKPASVNLNSSGSEDETAVLPLKDNAPRKHAYSASVIQSLGFDPALKPGQKRVEIKNVQDKLEVLEAVCKSRKNIALGPRPGPRIRSGVFAPKTEHKELSHPSKDKPDDEVPDGTTQVTQASLDRSPRQEKMIDLDDF